MSQLGSETLVVVERDGRIPAWIERHAGSAQRLTVHAQRAREPVRRFEARVLANVSGSELQGQRRAVLVCNGDFGAERAACRARLLRALARRVAAEGGGHVVLVADGHSALRLELASLASQLNDELDLDDTPVSVLFRAAPRQHGAPAPLAQAIEELATRVA